MGNMIGAKGHTLAVPQAALHWDGCKLDFESAAWSHFQLYLGLMDRLPADFGGDETGLGKELEQLRRLVREFGSPVLLRQLLFDAPQTLSGETTPRMAYAALVWWISGLQETAGLVASAVLSVQAPERDRGQHQEHLQLLGFVADKARRRIAPLIEALTRSKAPLIDANLDLSTACRRAGELLSVRRKRSARCMNASAGKSARSPSSGCSVRIGSRTY